MNDKISLIKKDKELLIVFEDYFTQESAILFTVGNPKTDWPDSMLKAMAEATVALMNKYYDELSQNEKQIFDKITEDEFNE